MNIQVNTELKPYFVEADGEFGVRTRLWLLASLFGTAFNLKETGERKKLSGIVDDACEALTTELAQEFEQFRAQQVSKSVKMELNRYISGLPNPQVADKTKVPQQNEREVRFNQYRAKIAKCLDEALGVSFFNKSDFTGQSAIARLTEYLEGKIILPSGTQRCLVHRSYSSPSDARNTLAKFSAGEKRLGIALNSYLSDCQDAVVQLPFVALAAATHLCSKLPFLEGSSYSESYVLRPDPTLNDENVYDTAIRALVRHIIRTDSTPLPLETLFSDIARRVRARKGLIIFASANWLTANRLESRIVIAADAKSSKHIFRSFMSGVCNLFDHKAPASLGAAPCVAFMTPQKIHFREYGRKSSTKAAKMSRALKRTLNELKPLNLHLHLRAARLPQTAEGNEDETILQMSYAQWQSFCDRRNVPYYFKIGPRLKTSQFWYLKQTRDDVWHRSIKMRSAIASNPEMHGYTDANFGITTLLGDLVYDEELACAINDVRDYISFLKPEALRAMRHIATGQFWVREDAVNKVFELQHEAQEEKRKVQNPRRYQRREFMDELEVDNLVDHQNGYGYALVRRTIDDETGDVHYSAALDVRAIVIEHWWDEIRKSDPDKAATERENWRILLQTAAFDIAQGLESSGGHREVPISEDMDAETQVWPEVFRKLIWSVRNYDPAPNSKRADPEKLKSGYIHEVIESHCAHPQDIYRVCFERIFIQKFRRGRMASNVFFARDDKADSVAAAMLQLISKDGQLGTPDPRLDNDLRGEYYSACANVLMALGDVEAVEKCLPHADNKEIKLLAFEGDVKGPEALNEVLAKHREIFGLKSENPVPHFEDIGDEDKFLAILKLILMTEKDPKIVDSVGLAMSEYACPGKSAEYQLHTACVLHRDAHRLSYPWNRPQTVEAKILLMRLFALFHERKAEALSCEIVSLQKDRLGSDGNASSTAAETLLSETPQDYLTKAAGFLDRCLDQLIPLNYENERMRLRIARSRIERMRTEDLNERERQRRLYDLEGDLNDIMRRAMNIGCSYDIFVELLLESAFSLAACGRPIRAYCAFARPALEIVDSIGYEGYHLETLECAKTMLKQIEILWTEGNAENWEVYTERAILAQQSLERIYNIPDLTEPMLDMPYTTASPSDKEPPSVFGFLLPQVKPRIIAFKDYQNALDEEKLFIQRCKSKRTHVPL
ncbi:hypothetical protein [Tateyamaria sp.]|uniref:hypothetical protein n=1 Tax=Tateyamaria sp. TaxID=1929288 RepID=UPI00329C32D4